MSHGLKNFLGETLANAVLKYRNRAVEAAQLIEEFFGLAKQMRAAVPGEKLDPTDAEARPMAPRPHL